MEFRRVLFRSGRASAYTTGTPRAARCGGCAASTRPRPTSTRSSRLSRERRPQPDRALFAGEPRSVRVEGERATEEVLDQVARVAAAPGLEDAAPVPARDVRIEQLPAERRQQVTCDHETPLVRVVARAVPGEMPRSEERRVGKEGSRKGISRGSR